MGLTAATAALACTVLLGGCGNNSAVSTEAPPTPMGQGTGAAPANTVAKKKTFEQLTLNSPAKAVTKNNIAYVSFSYVDHDGTASKCELPKAMTVGSYTDDDWIATFSVYKIPGAVKVNVAQKKQSGEINDFPFIAPKPHEAAGAAAPAKKQTVNMPSMPSMPQSAPTGPSAPMGPGGPMGPMGPMGPPRSMPGGK